MKITLFLLITAVCAYFLGGLNGSIIASRFFWKKDVREHGSGNAGLTNYLRTFGPAGVALVLITDIFKSVIAVLIGHWLLGLTGHAVTGRLFAGFCLMLGHIYPAFYQFRGGKGVLCAGTMVLLVDWRAGLICWVVFLVVVIFTQYVSLGSVCCALFFPLGLLIFSYRGIDVWLALFCALLLIFKHYQNILRLIHGKESKLSFGSKKNPF